MDSTVLGIIIYFFGVVGTFTYLAFTSDRLRTARAITASLLWPLFWVVGLISTVARIAAWVVLPREKYEKLKKDAGV